jgi:hypothetical protein
VSYINLFCILASRSVKRVYDRRTVFKLGTGVRFFCRFGSVMWKVSINKYYHFKLLYVDTCVSKVITFLLTDVFQVNTLW